VSAPFQERAGSWPPYLPLVKGGDGIERLIALGTATLGESGAFVVAGGLRPMWAGATCAGPARTVRCEPGDNLAIHVAVAALRAGEVLVVHVEAIPDRGYWGEVLTVAAQARSAAGLVIDACVRDTDALATRRFPVFATGVALPGAGKSGPGAVGEPVVIGGVTVEAGDIVVADADGVVVLAPASVARIGAAGQARADREAAMFTELAKGRTTVELLDLHDLSTIRIREGRA